MQKKSKYWYLFLFGFLLGYRIAAPLRLRPASDGPSLLLPLLRT